MNPGTLIVLFNPSDRQIANLIRNSQRCPNLIAIDNSPIVDSQLHARICDAGIEIIANFNTGGIAGAYNRGLERLIEKGAELLFLFDQDSEIPENYVFQMTEACSAIESPHFLAGPRILDVNVNRYAPVHIVTRHGISAVTFTGEDRHLRRCSSIISSGSVMSAATFRKVGPFREDYFIDHVDTEYCFRATTQEIPIYINPALTLKHQISRRADHKILFLRVAEWNMAPARQYYSARNCIHISRRYGADFPVLILINVITLQQIISIALFERNKLRKFLAMVAGIADGLRQKYGCFEMCWPAFSRICSKPEPQAS